MQLQITQEELSKKKLFLGTPMYGGSCLLKNRKVKTEDGEKTIKEIVDSKYNGKVLSFNEKNKEYEWKKVIGYRDASNIFPQKKWLKIKTTTDVRKLICTEDHQIYYFNDIFDREFKTIEAKNILGKYVLDESANHLFNNDQMSVLIGIMLGDGHITKYSAFRTTHCLKQKQYINYIKNILGGIISIEKPSGYSLDEKYTLRLPVNAQTQYLRNILYSNGKKEIFNIINMIDEKSLAFWYMDDGFVIQRDEKKQQNPYVMFCTDGFSKEENELLCKMLKDKFNLNANIVKYRQYFRIHISSLDTEKFFGIIERFVPETMKYKFNNNYDFVEEQYKFDSEYLVYGLRLVTDVCEYIGNSNLYDIEVEDNHNFIADNILVHNCIGLYTKSCMDLSVLCSHYGIELKFYALFNESLITRARNYICDEFMRSGFNHLLFIDADIGFDPQDIIALLAMQTDESPYDIIGAPYPKKNISWEKIVAAVNKGMADNDPNVLDQFVGDFVFNPKMGTTQIPLGEPCEVLEIGTGYMMIRRKTFEKFQEHFPEFLYRPDHVRTEHFDGSRQIMQFFQAEIDAVDAHKYFINELNELIKNNATAKDIEKLLSKYEELNKNKSNRYLSEDYWFCQKVQEVGLKTWLCPWMRTTHTGTMVYSGSLAALAQIQASPTADPNQLKKVKKI